MTACFSFVQTNPDVPMNPNYVNFEKPLNSTGRTHLTDQVVLLRKLLQAIYEKASHEKSYAGSSTKQPSLKRKQQQISAEAKRTKGSSVLKKNPAFVDTIDDDDIEVVYR